MPRTSRTATTTAATSSCRSNSVDGRSPGSSSSQPRSPQSAPIVSTAHGTTDGIDLDQWPDWDPGEDWTTSTIVAKRFGLRHGAVMRAIQSVTRERLGLVGEFSYVCHRDGKGRARQRVVMTDNGFVALLMVLKGDEAARARNLLGVLYLARGGKPIRCLMPEEGN